MSVRFAFLLFLTAVATQLHAATPPTSTAQPPVMVQHVGQVRYVQGDRASNIDLVIDGKGAMAYVNATTMMVVHSKSYLDGSDEFMDMYRVDLSLIGANQHARFEVLKQEPGIIRYIGPGDDPQGRVASRYSKIIYHDVYDGIDKVVTMTAYGPKVDYIVHAGADPRQIALRYTGASPLLLDNGSIIATTPLGTIEELAPVAYISTVNASPLRQMNSTVPVRFVVDGNTVRFDIGDYDRTQDLVIDPQRIWATYYGGNGGSNDVEALIGQNGDMYLVGSTTTKDLPVVPGVLQTRLRARTDAFAAKFTYDGRFVWHTYCGGTGSDMVFDAMLDKFEYVWMCGRLDSNNSPLINFERLGTGSAPYGGLEGDTIIMGAGYMLRLDSNGAWADSWLVDGREEDAILGFDIRNDRMAIVGYTRSPRVMDIQGNPYAHNPSNNFAQHDMFVSRLLLRPATTNRWQNDWLSYYGGNDDDWGQQVTLNDAGVVTAIGYTQSDNIPTTNGSTYRGNWDCFVVCFASPTPANPIRSWALYHSSSENEQALDAGTDAQGNPVFVGYTTGANFPTAAAYSATLRGGRDGFITKFNVGNGNLIFSTFIGGSDFETIEELSISRTGNVWIAGRTSSADLPVSNNAHQTQLYDDPDYTLADGFLMQFNANVTTLLHSTYYGAPPMPDLPPPPQMGDPPLPPDTDFGDDEITGMNTDGDAYIALGSRVTSLNMETTPGAFQDSTALNPDTVRSTAFLTMFSNCTDTAITITLNGPPTLCRTESRQLIGPAGFARYRWSNGDTVRTTTVSDTGRYILIATDFNGCRFRDTVRLTSSPAPEVTAGPDVSSCVNVVVQLTANPTGGTPPYRYKWRRLEAGPSFINNDTLQSPGVNPTSTSRYEVTVTDSVGCTDKDTIQVEVVNPLPTTAPPLVDFGLLDACEPSRDDTVVVRNPMSYPITVTGSVPDDPRIEVATALTPGVTIQGGDSAIIVLRITPGTTGVTNGTIKLTGQPCTWSVDVRYRVEKARLLATILPGTIDFGAGASCVTIEKDTFTVIRNGGSDPLVLDVGSVPAPFTILSPTSQRTLQPNDTVHARIRFAPTADGSYNEIARFPYTSGQCIDTLKVTVRGAKQTVSVDVSPTSINYGTLEGCEDEKDSTITITNSGSVTTTVTLPTLSDVVFQPAGPITLAAGESEQITVTIRPAASGAFTATPQISYQPCDGAIDLSLTAVKNGVAFTTPSAIALGELNTCTDAATKTVSYTVSFDGTGSSTVESIIIGNELTTTLTAGTTLQAGMPRTFDVAWTPSADGAMIDSIVILFQPCDVRRVIRLTGTRTTPSMRATQSLVQLGALTGNATGTIIFENDGTDTLYVEATATQNTTILDARPSPLQPLLPGATLEVDYEILCLSVIAETIQVNTTVGCVLSATTAFEGTCEQIVPDVHVVVAIDTVGVLVGQRFDLLIRIVESSGLNQAGLYTWDADITYNPMVVVGMGATPDCFSAGQFTPCTIRISGTRSQDTLGVIGSLDLTALLGNAAQTDVVLSNFQWAQDTSIVNEKRNGLVRINDICVEGGVRLLDPKSAAFNIRVYPIPATDDLTIDVRGMGTQPGTWTLANYVGQTLVSGPLTPDADGNALAIVDVRSIASGTYFLTIDARGTVNRMPVLIQR